MDYIIAEKYNKQLMKDAIKFHGMKYGDKCIVQGEKGIIKGWHTSKNELLYITVEVDNKGYSSNYDPDNVELIK